MQLKEVLMKTGLTKKAVRYYEECAMIQPEKASNGYKLYSEEDVKQLIRIGKLREMDFSVEEIKGIFRSEEEKRRIISVKMRENEHRLAVLYKRKKVLTAILEDHSIENLEIPQESVQAEQPYMHLRNVYRLFGWLNLISFGAIMFYTLFIVQSGVHSIETLVALHMVLAVVTVIWEIRRIKRKMKGIVSLEKKLGEMVFRYVMSLITFIVCGLILNESLFFSGVYFRDGSYFSAAINILMGLFFLSLSISLVVFSFFPDDLRFRDLLKKRGEVVH